MPAAMPVKARAHFLAQYQGHHAAAIRAQRHPDAELMRALRHRVRRHAEHADRCHQQRQQRRNPINSTIVNRSLPMAASMIWSIVWMLNNGRFGSTSRTAASIDRPSGRGVG